MIPSHIEIKYFQEGIVWEHVSCHLGCYVRMGFEIINAPLLSDPVYVIYLPSAILRNPHWASLPSPQLQYSLHITIIVLHRFAINRSSFKRR
jgi:hypothetical protein